MHYQFRTVNGYKVTVRTPAGNLAEFDYWSNENGYRYFFKARRDDEVRVYLASAALDLARLFQATGESSHARRAVLIIDRFAEVFPNWCYHYDYPFQQKIIYDGDVPPEQFRSGYRTARWNWWAYMDIPEDLLEAYELIRNSGAIEQLSREKSIDIDQRIRRDLFLNAGQQVLLNPEPFTNMSPTTWRSFITLGKVMNEPRYVHEVVRRLRTLMDRQFFYDGVWFEGAPSYGSQTVGGLEQVLRKLQGYSDPPDYVDAIDGQRYQNIDMEREFPTLNHARIALQKLKFSNGRPVPLNDTWAANFGHSSNRRRMTDFGSGPPELKSYLLPAFGHACLNFGAGLQATQFHLCWSGGYGHQHADGLNLTLFSSGKELLSDIGYTHTAYRAWAMSTVAHNTVAIDGLSQVMGSRQSPSDGSLRFIDMRDARVQVVSADATRVYPGVANTYRRTVIAVAVDDSQRYGIDLFEVEGGRTHDYFLHGDADNQSEVDTPGLAMAALDRLLPAGFDWTPTTNEGQTKRAVEPYYPFGFLRNLRTAVPEAGKFLEVDFKSGDGLGPALRVHLLPETGSQLVLGENPSIRRAQEDDAQLEKYMRPFLMLRHTANKNRSSFVSVVEPYQSRTFIGSVERLPSDTNAVIVKVAVGDRSDLIVIDTIKHLVGLLSIRKGKVEHAYALGELDWRKGDLRIDGKPTQRGKLIAVDSGSLVVEYSGSVLPFAGTVIRLVTADGWVYPFNVSSAKRNDDDTSIIHVAEGPGMDFQPDIRVLKLRSFPQREHQGENFVEWITSVSH